MSIINDLHRLRMSEMKKDPYDEMGDLVRKIKSEIDIENEVVEYMNDNWEDFLEKFLDQLQKKIRKYKLPSGDVWDHREVLEYFIDYIKEFGAWS